MRIAVLQFDILWEDPIGNLAKIDKLIGDRDDFDLLLLPEFFTSGFSMQGREKVATYYETTLSWMKDRASKWNSAIGGTIVYQEENNFYNKFLFITNDGKEYAYNKRHPFTYGEEHLYFKSGNQNVVIEYKGAKISPFICYDLRFPVWSRNTVGYDIAIYTANWPESRQYVWEVLLAARAIENQCFVVGINRIGTDLNRMEYVGGSCVINSRGKVIGKFEANEESLRVFQINLAQLRNFRSKFPVLNDRDSFIICDQENMNINLE